MGKGMGESKEKHSGTGYKKTRRLLFPLQLAIDNESEDLNSKVTRNLPNCDHVVLSAQPKPLRFAQSFPTSFISIEKLLLSRRIEEIQT